MATSTKPKQKPIESLGIRAMFLVWSHPQGSHRSQFIADYLGMPLQYVYFTKRRGALAALLKYPVQALLTIWVLIRHRPQLVFVQDPPIVGAFVVWFCSFILPLRFIIDSHTQRHCLVEYPFLLSTRRFLAGRALTNIVTNSFLETMVRTWDAAAIVMEDPPLPFADSIKAIPLDGIFNVVWVNVGALDEPRDIFFQAAEALPDITFYVTSNYDRNKELRLYKKHASANVVFTGHLPDHDYYQLLKSADVVLTLTTRDHALQQGACEAMWLGRPVITSDWAMLRAYFTHGALFVDNSVASLIDGLTEMQNQHPKYVETIQELIPLRRADWENQVRDLMTIIESHVPL